MRQHLSWHSVTSSLDARFMVKGAEIATAVCGPQARFQICEHRCYDADRFLSENYRVRDANTVSDDDIRSGIRPRVVGYFDDMDAAVAFCMGGGLPPKHLASAPTC